MQTNPLSYLIAQERIHDFFLGFLAYSGDDTTCFKISRIALTALSYPVC